MKKVFGPDTNNNNNIVRNIALCTVMGSILLQHIVSHPQ